MALQSTGFRADRLKFYLGQTKTFLLRASPIAFVMFNHFRRAARIAGELQTNGEAREVNSGEAGSRSSRRL